MQHSADVLKELANYRMPFGKYKDIRLIDLPEAYILWFKQRRGLPRGKLGRLMEEIYQIKLNGIEQILDPFRE